MPHLATTQTPTRAESDEANFAPMTVRPSKHILGQNANDRMPSLGTLTWKIPPSQLQDTNFGNWRFCNHIQGCFPIENGQNRSHFTLSPKVRATIGLVPTAQPPRWCYKETEETIWRRNGLVETSTLCRVFAKWLLERPEMPENFVIEHPLTNILAFFYIGTGCGLRHEPSHSCVVYLS